MQNILSALLCSGVAYGAINRMDVYRLPLEGSSYHQFYAKVSLGTPPQPFKFVPSTLSSSVLVPSVSCSSDDCSRLSKYNSSASSTYRQNGTEADNDGSYRGIVSQDTLTIGNLKVLNQDFVEISQADQELAGGYDGYFGLGLPESTILDMVSPFYNMLNQGSLAKPVFTLRLPSSSSPGQIVFGGIDHADYKGKIQYVPVQRRSLWGLELRYVQVNKTRLDISNTTAVIDSASSFIIMPADMAKAINLQIGAKPDKDEDTQLNTVSCRNISRLPDIKFRFGNVSLALKGKDYILENNGTCRSVFLGFDLHQPEDNVKWYIGTVFLRHWFTVFDVGRGRIGFARPA